MENEIATLTIGADVMDKSPTVVAARKLAEVSSQKFDTIIRVPFKYSMDGRWHHIDLNFREYLELLQTGVVDDKQICCIEVSETRDDKEDSMDTIRMVYDFVSLHTGGNPWRMV